MKLDLALNRKLLLLVAVPLAGALIFVGIQVGRHLLELRTLGRVESAVGLSSDLDALRQNLLVEQRDVSDMTQETNRRLAYRDHANLTDASIGKLRARFAGDDSALERANVRDALAAVFAAHERLPDARTYFSQPHTTDRAGAEARGFYQRYVDISELLFTVLEIIAQESDVTAIRSRLEEVVGLDRMVAAAERERMYLDQGFAHSPLTVAFHVRTRNATAERTYFESNAVLMAPPEHADYWRALLENPVYTRAAALPTLIYSETSAEARAFNTAHRGEWATVSRDRNQLLDEIAPRFLAEIGALVAAQRAEVRQQLFRVALPGVILTCISIGIALLLVRRLERKLRAAHAGLAGGVEAIARSVAAATEAAQRLAEGASKEAAGLEQTGSALVALTGVNQKNVATAKQTVDQMLETGKLVGNSREAMQSLAETMSKISESSNATFRIVKTINEIAFQTSILALNASIEAARAGSAGTGFAVVADEVRNLAKRAAEATAETGRLVDEARAAIESGTGLSDEVVSALRDVATNATKSGELMANIHSASEQMLQNMQHINTGNRSLETVTQQNAAIADRNTAAAAAISSETGRLQETIGGLERLLVGAPSA